MKIDALSQHSPPPCRVHRLDGQLLANVEQKDVLTLRRVAHEVHEAGRAKRARSEAVKCEFGIRGMWCGLAGWEQLAWLTAKIAALEWHVEVEKLAEISVLEGHVASSRPMWLRRYRFSKCSVLLLSLCCPIRKYMQLNLLLESQGEKKKTEHFASTDERACLGGSAGGW